MSKTNPTTLAEAVQSFIPTTERPKAIVKQIDAGTIRVQKQGSQSYLSNVILVGATLGSITIGQEVEVEIVDGQAYAYALRPLDGNISVQGGLSILFTGHGTLSLAVPNSGTLLVGDANLSYAPLTGTLAVGGPLDMGVQAGTPSNPSAGRYKVYWKGTALYSLDSSGVEVLIANPSAGILTGSGSSGLLTYWTGTNALSGSINILIDSAGAFDLAVLGSAPANPGAGHVKVYVKAGGIYTLTSAGVETLVGGSSLSGVVGRVPYFDTTTSLAGSANLTWDNATSTLALGGPLTVAGHMAMGQYGSITADNTLLINQGSTYTAGNANAFLAIMNGNPGANSTAQFIGVWGEATSLTGNIRTFGSMIGVVGTGIHDGTAAIAAVYGVSASAKNINSGVAADVRGLDARVQNTGAGSITNAYGVYVGNPIVSAGSIASAVGMYVEDHTTATNNTDILIGTQAAGQWAFYSTSTKQSYLAKGFGIGTYPNNSHHLLAVYLADDGLATTYNILSSSSIEAAPGSYLASNFWVGLYGAASTPVAGGYNVNSIRGINAQVNHNSSHVLSEGIGLLVGATNNGTGAITALHGIYVDGELVGTGNVDVYHGITIADLYHPGAGVNQENYGLVIYGQTGGSVANADIVLGSPPVSGNWAIYSNTGYKSFFSGPVGVGGFNPSYAQKLYVLDYGTISADYGQAGTELSIVTTGNNAYGIQGWGTTMYTSGGDSYNYGTFRGGKFLTQHNGSGAVASMRAVIGYIDNEGVGTVTQGISFLANRNNISTGTITKGYGLYVDSPSNALGTYTTDVGVFVQTQTAVANSVALLIHTPSPTGHWAIYSGSTYPSLFSAEFNMAEIATPATPAAGLLAIYAKADHNVYVKNSSGIETQIGSGGSGLTQAQVLARASLRG